MLKDTVIDKVYIRSRCTFIAPCRECFCETDNCPPWREHFPEPDTAFSHCSRSHGKLSGGGLSTLWDLCVMLDESRFCQVWNQQSFPCPPVLPSFPRLGVFLFLSHMLVINQSELRMKERKAGSLTKGKKRQDEESRSTVCTWRGCLRRWCLPQRCREVICTSLPHTSFPNSRCSPRVK